MEELNPRLLAQIKAIDPTVDEQDIFYLMVSNLDLNEPNRQVKSITAFSRQKLSVYTNEQKIMEIPMEQLEELSVISGVGCAFASYRTRSGEDVLFARADTRYEPLMGKAIKRVNHYLRHGDLDFSRFSDASGRSCPKCGKPYPRGSHSCPHCQSKKKTILRLVRYAKPEWKAILISVLLFFVTTAVSVVTPYINRVLVDDYIRADASSILWIGFISVILSMLAANLLRRLVSIARGYFLTEAGNSLIVRLRDTVFRKIQELSIAKISSRTSGELMTRVNHDTTVIKQFLVNHLPGILEQALVLVAISAVLFGYDWQLALLILIPAPFVAWAFRLFWRFIRTMSIRSREINSKSNAILHDIFSGIRVVKSYGMEKREEERFVSNAARERDTRMRLETHWAILLPILQLLMGVGEFVLLYYVGNKMIGGEMSAGQMSQFSTYATMIYTPLNTLMLFPRHFVQMMTSTTRVFEILDEQIEIEDHKREERMTLQGQVELRNVSFGYEDSKEVLRDINLTIQPGEFVGLVGRSGVGKSTLINLIMRMYDVDEGEILIDGVDIRQIPQEELRSQMGVVLQENFLFTGSVWQNLTYAKPDATYEEVIQASKSAGAHEFIIRLPDGYNTYVGEKGHTLSGGERQRISIARALLHNPKILILDEATASLDTETEKLIQDALQALSAGRTTIAIAHRLSTLRNATRLVVFDKGQIAEMGTHDELMAKEGLYYGLVMAQREMSKME